jgi:hypothetical protein
LQRLQGRRYRVLLPISVKIREGIPVTEIAANVGHSRKSLDTYAHVIDESGK